jgi:mannose-6-phosphate isomerase-like protein (cupin superfamily)
MTSATQPRRQELAGNLHIWHVVSDAVTLFEADVVPGAEPPIHVHANEDEVYYVLDGEVTFLRGLERIEARAGDAVALPRGIQHGFAVRSTTARVLCAMTPGGLEAAFFALDGVEPTPEAFGEAFAARGITFTGPPLPALS